MSYFKELFKGHLNETIYNTIDKNTIEKLKPGDEIDYNNEINTIALTKGKRIQITNAKDLYKITFKNGKEVFIYGEDIRLMQKILK